jgi:DNA polymerase-3 subunit delta'
MALSPFSQDSKEEAISGEKEIFSRLCPDQFAARHWANMQLELNQSVVKGVEANLDPSSLILDMGFKIEATAAKIFN